MFSTTNCLAVVVSAAVYMALGFFWYSPKVLGNLWLKHAKVPAETGHPNTTYVTLAVTSLVTAFVLSLLIDWCDVRTLREGIGLSVMIWFGFGVTRGLMPVLFTKKPWEMFLIDEGYMAVGMVAMGTILTIWN